MSLASLLFAGHSLAIAARFIIGWLAAFAAIILALGAIVSGRVDFQTGFASSWRAHHGRLALGAIGVTAKLHKHMRPTSATPAARTNLGDLFDRKEMA
jgi:hypothetical protein